MPRHDRPLPPDFEAVFIKKGRLDCEEHFKAGRKTVTAWLEQCGKERLIEARAAHVARLRSVGQWPTRSSSLIAHREIRRPSIGERATDRRQICDSVARQAAHHLRVWRHGGMIVSRAGDGEWWIGLRRVSAAQLVDLAKSRGFNPETAFTPALTLKPNGDTDARAAT